MIESGNKMAARLSVVDGAKGPGRNRDAKQERSRRRRQVLSEVVMQLVREKGLRRHLDQRGCGARVDQRRRSLSPHRYQKRSARTRLR
ncbi:hypothetical protein ACFSTD_19455 [Novosphingobium colocasiae]